MDSTAMFYAQPSNMSAYPVYEKTQIQQRGGIQPGRLKPGTKVPFLPDWMQSKKKFKRKVAEGITHGILNLVL